MPTRRPLLALPFLLVARPLWARTPAWQADVSEIRVGGVPAAAASARLGVAVRSVTQDLAEALNEGHVEAALLDSATTSRARGLMGARVVLTPAGAGTIAVRRALPDSLRADLGVTLALLAA